MGLTPCRVCAHLVSTDATSCPSCGAPKPSQRRGGNRSRLLVLVAAVLIVGSLRSMVIADAPTVGQAGMPVPTPGAAARRMADSLARGEHQRALDVARATFIRLRPRFSCRPDEVKGGGWYTALGWTPRELWDATYLDAPLTDQGRVYLRSNLARKGWIFHERLIVRVGDQVLQTETVPSFDPSNERDNGSDFIFETIHFTQNRDAGVLAAIASNADKVIRVRFEGDQRSYDVVLTNANKRVIRDAVELGGALRTLNATGCGFTVEGMRLSGAPTKRASGETKSAPEGLWLANAFGTKYYKAGCAEAQKIPEESRVYYRSEAAAKAAGFERATLEKC